MILENLSVLPSFVVISKPASDTLLLLLIIFVFPFLTGYAFAFGGQSDTTNTTFIGTTDFASVGPSASFWFFEYAFSATSVTIVAGTLAERCQMAAYLCYSVFLAGLVYPVVNTNRSVFFDMLWCPLSC